MYRDIYSCFSELRRSVRWVRVSLPSSGFLLRIWATDLLWESAGYCRRSWSENCPLGRGQKKVKRYKPFVEAVHHQLQRKQQTYLENDRLVYCRKLDTDRRTHRTTTVTLAAHVHRGLIKPYDAQKLYKKWVLSCTYNCMYLHWVQGVQNRH